MFHGRTGPPTGSVNGHRFRVAIAAQFFVPYQISILQSRQWMDGDWKYVGEGGKHALFEIDSLAGKLLRIDKGFFRIAESGIDPPAEAVHELAHSDGYIESIVAPSLIPYVDIPEVVALTWGLLRRLRNISLEAAVILPSRIHDWQPDHEAHRKLVSVQPIGMLVVDYRRLPRSMTSSNCVLSPRRICIELKPKAGYLSWSPLINPRHRTKLTKSRFSLLQTLHQQGLVEKGWANSCEGVRKSDYEPLDLFSGDTTRMAQAIQKLIVTPQNNFRLWYNDQSITSHGTLNASDMTKMMKDVTGIHDLSMEECESRFVSFVEGLLLPALTRESLIGKLLTLQKLDVLDVDGAALVSERLLQICEGSRQAAEEFLSSWTRGSDHEQGAIHDLFENSPFRAPDERVALLELCGLVEQLYTIMTGSYPDLPSKRSLDDLHFKSTQLVARLSKQECAFLLANWLLSLAMCDVSIFLTFEQLAVPTAGSDAPAFAGDNESPGSTQSGEVAHSDGIGIVGLNQRNGSTGCFAYLMRIIDCDEKPTKKIWDRMERETVFASLSIEG